MMGGRGGIGDGEGMGTLVSALQTVSEVSEFARLDEDKANSPVTAVIGEEEVRDRKALVRFIAMKIECTQLV